MGPANSIHTLGPNSTQDRVHITLGWLVSKRRVGEITLLGSNVEKRIVQNYIQQPMK